jgi:hypothetical protein
MDLVMAFRRFPSWLQRCQQRERGIELLLSKINVTGAPKSVKRERERDREALARDNLLSGLRLDDLEEQDDVSWKLCGLFEEHSKLRACVTVALQTTHRSGYPG